jgi:hypothetical protein
VTRRGQQHLTEFALFAPPTLSERLLSYVEQLRDEAEELGCRGQLTAAVVYRNVARELERIIKRPGAPVTACGTRRQRSRRSSPLGPATWTTAR